MESTVMNTMGGFQENAAAGMSQGNLGNSYAGLKRADSDIKPVHINANDSMAALDNIGFSPIKEKQQSDDQKSKFKIPGLQHAYNGSEVPKQPQFVMDSYAQPNPYSTALPSQGQAIGGQNLLPDTLPLFVAVPSPGVSPDRPQAPVIPPTRDLPAPDNPFFALSGMSTPSSPFVASPPHPHAGFAGFSAQAMQTQQSFDGMSPFNMNAGTGMPHHMWAMGQGIHNFAAPPPVMSAGSTPHAAYPPAPWLPVSPSPHIPPQSVGGHPSGSRLSPSKEE